MPVLHPGEAAIACNATALLSADDFLLSYVVLQGTVLDDHSLFYNFSNRVDLEVTRSVLAQAQPHFRKQSKCGHGL